MTYKDTSLWRNSIGNDSYNETELRAKLKNQYELARKNAIFLLDKIRKDFPNLTVHDITHIETCVAAMVGASILLLFEKPTEILKDVEWNTIFFFIGLLIICGI